MILKPRPLSERLLDSRGRRFSDPRSHFSRMHRQRGFIINPFLSAAGDPADPFVVLSLHMEGANNSTTFTDSSASAHTGTAFGDAKLSTARSVVGGASSGLFDGTGDYVTFPNSANFNLGAGSFCIRGWFYPTTLGVTRGILGQSSVSNTDTSWHILQSTADSLRIIFTTGGSYGGSSTYDGYSSTLAFTANAWNFFVVQRAATGATAGQELAFGIGLVGGNIAWNTAGSGGITTFSSSASYTSTLYSSSQPLTVGRDPAGVGSITGNLKDVQIIKGYAPYLNYASNKPGTFAVPAAPLTP